MNPCITCTKQSGAEQKSIPIKDEHEAAVFERPFRTQETNAPHGCGSSGVFRACCGSWVGSSGTRRACCASGVARAAPIGHSAVPGHTSGTRRAFCGSGADSSITFRVFCGSGAGSSGHFEPSAVWGGLEQPFRAICGSGPSSRGHMPQIAAFREARQAGHEALSTVKSRAPKQTL